MTTDAKIHFLLNSNDEEFYMSHHNACHLKH